MIATRYQEQPPKSERSSKDKLGDEDPHTEESLKNLFNLYEAWDKPEEAKEWRAILQQFLQQSEAVYSSLQQILVVSSSQTSKKEKPCD